MLAFLNDPCAVRLVFGVGSEESQGGGVAASCTASGDGEHRLVPAQTHPVAPSPRPSAREAWAGVQQSVDLMVAGQLPGRTSTLRCETSPEGSTYLACRSRSTLTLRCMPRMCFCMYTGIIF